MDKSVVLNLFSMLLAKNIGVEEAWKKAKEFASDLDGKSPEE